MMASMVRALFFLLALCSVPFWKGKITQHFHPSKLQIDLPYRVEWENKETPLEERSFRFLGKGSQTYVFESADQKLVLKLFRCNRSRFPWIHSLKGWFHKKRKADLLTKLDKTFQAYELAFKHVPEQTGLLAIHLNATKERWPKIEVRDALGRKWSLSLDRYRFVLQKKAESFEEALLAARGDETKIQAMVDSFIELLKERAGKGIRNSDPNLAPNFGFIDGKAVEIDCGNFRWKPELIDDPTEEVDRFVQPLQAWLKKSLRNSEI